VRFRVLDITKNIMKKHMFFTGCATGVDVGLRDRARTQIRILPKF
jgi:hypothetical protein